MATAGVAAVTLAVAAAIAIYESDEVRRVAEDIRRRIAIAIQSIGNEFNHTSQSEPLFNRPEDAEGFLLSRSAEGADPGVDADEPTRKRQREELMYWNAVRESRLMAQEREARDAAITAATEYGKSVGSDPSSARNFDDFLRQEEGAAAGTFVFLTGAEVENRQGITRRRGPNPATYANPFADENQVDIEDIEEAATPPSTTGTDMYHVTPRVSPPVPPNPFIPVMAPLPEPATHVPVPATGPWSESPAHAIEVAPSQSSVTMSGTAADEELAEDEFMTAGQDQNAYSSIQAWAQGNQPDFYSPLPMSPEPPASEVEVVSVGQLTPTDSASVVDVGHDFEPITDGEGRDFDVISESDGIATPASWSEVGSVVSDSEPPTLA
jgi:hypothetical protein